MNQTFIERYKGYEECHPGITEQIWRFEQLTLPTCIRCGSSDTAEVQIGVIGRTMTIRGATKKVKFIPWGPKPGRFYCNICGKFFTPLIWYEPIRDHG